MSVELDIDGCGDPRTESPYFAGSYCTATDARLLKWETGDYCYVPKLDKFRFFLDENYPTLYCCGLLDRVYAHALSPPSLHVHTPPFDAGL